MELPETLPDVVLTIDRDTISRYADATLDYNPVHVDPAFAATTTFGRIIAHGTLSVNLIWQAIEGIAAWSGRGNYRLEVRFLLPVCIGDTVAAGGNLISRATGDYKVWVTNQKGQKVIEGTAWFERRSDQAAE